jgi:hypothetical protein
MKRLLLLLPLLTGIPAFGLSVAGPPMPPLGWEEQVTPGFDPPIEETLVFDYHAQPAEQAEFAEAWGQVALPVLKRLIADPNWAEYKDVIQTYVQLLDGKAFDGDLEQLVRDLFTRISKGEKIETADSQLLFRIAPDATDAMREIVREAYAASDEKLQAGMMQYWVSVFSEQRRIAFLESCLEAAKGEANRRQIQRLIDEARARNRAHEPMSKILKWEKRGETQL